MKFICYESFNLNHITRKVKFKKRITDNLKGIKEKKRKEKKKLYTHIKAWQQQIEEKLKAFLQFLKENKTSNL